MFARLVYESFRRQKRRKLLAGAAITLGVTVATAMIAVATDIGDKINRELRTIGANLLITPEEDTLDVEIGGVNLKPPSDGAFLNEADLSKIKGTFWHNNITGFAPMLPVNVTLQRDGHTENLTLLGTYFAKRISFGKEEFTTGVRSTHLWWKVSGTWPDDDSRDVLLGERLAARFSAKPGNEATISGRKLQVSGILSTGGSEDDQIVAPIALAQEIIGKPGAVRRVYVSALTKPEDALARRDPRSMSGLAVSAVDCVSVARGDSALACRADSASCAERGRGTDAHRGADLSYHTGRAVCFSAGGFCRNGDSYV
jgi:putative ABC transport system permease protein